MFNFQMESWSVVFVLLILVAGLIMIIKGGDYFVDSASWFAEVSGIPKLIVGATVVSVATTLPELLVSSMAAAGGSVDMAAGNAIGSVTANTAMIMALSIIFMPSKVDRKDYVVKTVLMLLPMVLMFAFSFKGFNVPSTFGLVGSGILLAIFAYNVYDNIASAKRNMLMDKQDGKSDEKIKPDKKTVIINVIKFIVGTVGIVFGADFLVDSATEVAHRLNVSEQIIGLTIVAIGTSLPELVTTITAIVKKESSLSVGNVIGANILDICLIMPICAFICGKGIPVSAQTVTLDIPFCFLVGAIALIPMLIHGKFSKWQGYVLLALYIAYVVGMCFLAPYFA